MASHKPATPPPASALPATSSKPPLPPSFRSASAQRLATTAWIEKAEGTRTSLTYHADDQIGNQGEFKSRNSVISGFDYQRDGVGNPTRLREATGRLTTWSYDERYQLINEHRSSAAGGFNTTHTYDPVGNRLVKNESGAITTSTFDAGNQTIAAVSPTGTTTYTFDAAGNQQVEQAPSGVTTHTWNYENQRTLIVKPSGVRVTMAYNADSRRVQRQS